MRHTFRLNVYQKGYTLFSGQPPTPYQEFPLDILSSGVSRNYLSAQKRIDAMLGTQASRWHFCIANLNSNEYPVVAYGCLLPAKDDKGRTGINFIHAIQGDEGFGIDEVVVCIIKLLAQQTIEQLIELLSALAKGSVKPERTIEFLTNQFERPYHRPVNVSSTQSKPVKEIQHDCGGASAVAWLAMTISHLGNSSSWEIYEEYSHHTGLIATVSSCMGASATHYLSEYLYQLIYDHELLENLYTQRSSPQRGSFVTSTVEKKLSFPDAAIDDAPLPTDVKHHKSEIAYVEVTPERRDILKYPSEKNPQQRTESTFSRTHQQRYYHYPVDSNIVTMDGLFANELSLIGSDREYRITNNNYFSHKDNPDHYEFVIVQPKWFGLSEDQIKLILPKHNLTDSQVKQLNVFLMYFTPTDHNMR